MPGPRPKRPFPDIVHSPTSRHGGAIWVHVPIKARGFGHMQTSTGKAIRSNTTIEFDLRCILTAVPLGWGAVCPPFIGIFFQDVWSVEKWREALRISFRKLLLSPCNPIFACFVKNRSISYSICKFFANRTYFKLQGHRSLC